MRQMFATRRWLFVAITVLLTYTFVVKLVAAHQLSYIADEPDDVANIVADVEAARTFFTNVPSVDQGRLPHIVSVPFVVLFGTNSLFANRLLFILIYAAYLLVIFYTFRLKLSPLQAFYGLLLTAFSSYLFSFSIFTMTTSNSLYLFFGMLSVYYYLRHFENKRLSSIDRVFVLGIIFGLAIASKLFGLIIIIAIFAYDAWLSRKVILKKGMDSIWAMPLERTNIVFLLGLFAINVLPVALPIKMLLAVCASVSYIIVSIFLYIHNKKRAWRLSFFGKWIFLIHTAFTATIIASPIYLNFINILGIFKWSNTWNTVGNVVNPSRWDIYRIIEIKVGAFILLCVLAALGVLYYRRQLKQMLRQNVLPLLIIGLHLVIFTSSTFILVWYPLFIIPFLYIPLCYIFPTNFSRFNNVVSVAMAIVMISLPIFEQWRYFRLFPYGHTDGAQNGVQYVGWNKPGFITFEGVPMLQDYLKNQDNSLEPGDISCNVVAVERYNKWAIKILNHELISQGVDDFMCRDPAKSKDNKYVLTSVYTSKDFLAEVENSYYRQKEFIVNTVPAVTFWVKNNANLSLGNGYE